MEEHWNLELDGRCVPAYRGSDAVFGSRESCEHFAKHYHRQRHSGNLLGFAPFQGSDAEGHADTPKNQWTPRGPDDPHLI